MSLAARRRGGFTLIEVLAVVFLTSVVISLALNFYVELSRSTTRATGLTRDIRRATSILDRVARDFEGTVLLMKQPDQDPVTHPWLFLGESRGSELGADHVKFDTFSHQVRGSDRRETDLAVVAYLTRDDLDHGLELLRWSSSQLPEGLDREFPLPEDQDVMLLADGLAGFGVRFLGEDGEWKDSWDSSTLVESGQLPLAVEIEVALDDQEDLFGSEPVARFSRTVLLPVRPIDPAQLTPAASTPENQLSDAERVALCNTPASLLQALDPETRAQIEAQCAESPQ